MNRSGPSVRYRQCNSRETKVEERTVKVPPDKYLVAFGAASSLLVILVLLAAGFNGGRLQGFLLGAPAPIPGLVLAFYLYNRESGVMRP